MYRHLAQLSKNKALPNGRRDRSWPPEPCLWHLGLLYGRKRDRKAGRYPTWEQLGISQGFTTPPLISWQTDVKRQRGPTLRPQRDKMALRGGWCHLAFIFRQQLLQITIQRCKHWLYGTAVLHVKGACTHMQTNHKGTDSFAVWVFKKYIQGCIYLILTSGPTYSTQVNSGKSCSKDSSSSLQCRGVAEGAQ